MMKMKPMHLIIIALVYCIIGNEYRVERVYLNQMPASKTSQAERRIESLRIMNLIEPGQEEGPRRKKRIREN